MRWAVFEACRASSGASTRRGGRCCAGHVVGVERVDGPVEAGEQLVAPRVVEGQLAHESR